MRSKPESGEQKCQFIDGMRKVLDAYPQVAEGKLRWVACGSAAWFSLMYADEIDALDQTELPYPVSRGTMFRSEICWAETAPDRRIKDIDVLQYSGESLNGKTVRIGNLDAAFHHDSPASTCPKGSIYLDAAYSKLGFGRPVMCTIKDELEVFSVSPEVNVAHKFSYSFDRSWLGNHTQAKKAVRDLALMEPLQPLLNSAVFLEYLLDESQPPNDFFQRVRKGDVNAKAFRDVPEVWREFVEGTVMHPSGIGQYFMPVIGIMDLSLIQRLNYFSIAEHYANLGVPLKDLRRHLQECHREGKPPDYERLDTWDVLEPDAKRKKVSPLRRFLKKI